MSCFLVMADLRGSDCLSVEECTSVFKSDYQWERRLVETTAVKESDVIKKVASIMDKHDPSREEAKALKGILKIDVLDFCSFDLCLQIFTHHYVLNICVGTYYMFLYGCVLTQCCHSNFVCRIVSLK